MRRAFTLGLPTLRMGHNNVGQLGRPEDPGAHEIMSTIAAGACGFLHSLLLHSDGTMYSFGKAAGGRLGNGNDQDDCYEPHASFKVAGPIGSLSSGSMHNAFVTEDGEILAWGYDSHGQVGCLGEPKGALPRQVPRPTPLDVNEKFTQVSCSGFHSAALSQFGRVYAWGRSDFGRCGVKQPITHKGEDDTVPIWRPRLVSEINETISKVSAGGFFTLALGKDGRSLFSFGGNGNGELGTGSKSKYEWSPQRVLFEEGLLQSDEVIADIATGGFHSCILTNKGRVLGFGDNHSKQIGVKNGATSIPKPTLLDVLPNNACTAISCGPTFTAAVTDRTKLWLIGSAPSANEAQLVFESPKGETITMPEKQGAHHLMFFLSKDA